MNRQNLISRLIARNLPTGQKAGCVPCLAGQPRHNNTSATNARALCINAVSNAGAICWAGPSKS